MIVSISGTLVDESEALISPFDHGLLVGNGVFETLGVYDSVPFAWRRHYERLVRSAAGLDLAVPSSDDLRSRADAVLAANDLSDARLRITVTGGPSPLGSARGDAPPTVIVVTTPAGSWPAAVELVTVPWPRNERGAMAGLKTISYAENVRALAYAAEQGGGEAVFANTRGELCEGTGANVFLVRDGVLRTPSTESGCLAGVTRALVLELAEQLGIAAQERALPMDALADAEEVFITSSTREIQPASSVDGRTIPAPGPVTEHLSSAFADLVASNPDP